MMNNIYFFMDDENNVEYKVEYKTKKKMKNIIVKYNPKNGIIVSKPSYVSKLKCYEFLCDNKNKILDLIKESLDVTDIKSLKYIFFNGKKYNLVIKKSSFDKCILDTLNMNIEINYFKVTPEKILYEFYKKSLEEKIKMDLDYYVEIMNKDKNNISYNKVSIYYMKTRWGSCSCCNKNLHFNINLMFLDDEYIKYVVAHELSHLVFPNHSEHFWRFVEKYFYNARAYSKEINKSQIQKITKFF